MRLAQEAKDRKRVDRERPKVRDWTCFTLGESC